MKDQEIIEKVEGFDLDKFAKEDHRARLQEAIRLAREDEKVKCKNCSQKINMKITHSEDDF